MVDQIRVGIGDFKAAFPPYKIITIGLGSCVGIALYDKKNRIGGLAHIMLPDSTQFSNITNPDKFADLAIPRLVNQMKAMGAQMNTVYAKIAGGASMFNFSDKSLVMDIGGRNVQSVKDILFNLHINILGQDTGGNQGRTMLIDVELGKTYIRTINNKMIEI